MKNESWPMRCSRRPERPPQGEALPHTPPRIPADSADKQFMDQRRQPRLDAAGPARVTLLGEARKQVGGRVINTSRQGIRLILEERVSPGALLAVEWADTEAMGEVCYCEETEGGFAVGVRLEHVLLHTAELARLAARLLGESEAERVTGSARPV